MGRFNGHGHKISNVIVRESTEEVGFFGKSGGANSLVANVILESIDVRSTYEGDKIPIPRQAGSSAMPESATTATVQGLPTALSAAM